MRLTKVKLHRSVHQKSKTGFYSTVESVEKVQEMSTQVNDGPVKACLQGYIPDGFISLESGL